MEEICSFPEPHFGDPTSVSLGNALSPFSYTARQETESSFKEFGCNKGILLNWHRVSTLTFKQGH